MYGEIGQQIVATPLRVSSSATNPIPRMLVSRSSVENLSKGLGFSKEDRDENVRRIAFVCELLSRHGVIAIVAAVSPYRSVRDEARARIPNFVEVYVECPLDVLIERDTKGLYRKALAGEIQQFTGISDPYEPPLAPEVVLHSALETVEESVEKVWTALESLGLIRSGSIKPAESQSR